MRTEKSYSNVWVYLELLKFPLVEVVPPANAVNQSGFAEESLLSVFGLVLWVVLKAQWSLKCAPSPPLNPHPAETVLSMCFVVNICYGSLCCPRVTQGMALTPIDSSQSPHVLRDILYPKAVCGMLCCFFRPQMFSPGDHVWYHSHTWCAHVLATVKGLSPLGGAQGPK
jgi:hypothetical protein